MQSSVKYANLHLRMYPSFDVLKSTAFIFCNFPFSETYKLLELHSNCLMSNSYVRKFNK